jgi:large subunit ribosomal protein L6
MKTEVPLKGTKASFEGQILTISGKKGSVKRKLWHPYVNVKIEGDKIVLNTPRERKKDKRMINTFSNHVKNMVTGANSGFRYTMEMVQSHFPMQMKLEGNIFQIENFLGEKLPRTMKIPEGVKVNVNQKEKKVVVESLDIELAGKTATLIEHLTRVTGKDRRIFQDGIYLMGREVVEGGSA